MKRFIYIALATFLILGLTLFLALNHLLQPEKVRSRIADALSGVWAGRVSVGSASISFPASIDVNNIYLDTHDGKQRIAGLGSFTLVPRLMPLLQGKVVFEKIILQSPYLSLKKDENNVFLVKSCLASTHGPGNHNSEESKSPATSTTGAPGFFKEILIESIQIRDAIIALPGELEAGPFSGRFSLSLDPSLRLRGKISQPPAEFSVRGMKAPLKTGNFEITLNMLGKTASGSFSLDSLSAPLPGLPPLTLKTLSASFRLNESGQLSINPLKLDMPRGGKVALVVAAGPDVVSADVTAQSIDIAGILGESISSLKLDKAGKTAIRLENLGGTIRKPANGAINLSAWKGKFASGGIVTLEGKIDSANTRLHLNLTHFPLYQPLSGLIAPYEFGPIVKKLELVSLEANIKPDETVLSNIEVRVGKSSNAKGTVHLKPDATFRDASAFTVSVSGTDVFSLLKLVPIHNLQGAVNGSLKLSGGIASPVMNGRLNANRLLYTHSAAPPITLENVSAKLSMKDLMLSLDEFAAGFFGGKIHGHGSLDLNSTPLSYKFQLDSVEVRLAKMAETVPLFKGHFVGSVRAVTEGNGTGTEINGLTAGGSITAEQVALNDLAGLVLPSLSGDKGLLSAIRKPLKNILDRPEVRHFPLQTVTSSLKIKDGALLLKNIKTTAPVDLVTEGFSYSLSEGSMNGKLSISVPTSETGKISLPLAFSGTLASPVLKVDAAAVKKQLAKQALNKLTNKLKGRAGAVAGLLGTSSPKSTETSSPGLKNKARNLLRGLFR